MCERIACECSRAYLRGEGDREYDGERCRARPLRDSGDDDLESSDLDGLRRRMRPSLASGDREREREMRRLESWEWEERDSGREYERLGVTEREYDRPLDLDREE